MRKLAKTLSVISAVLLLFALLVGALLSIYVDQAWVPQEYRKLDIESQTDWDFTTTVTAFKGMLDYSIGRIDTLEDVKLNDGPFFNESELSHMRDVQKLTVTVMDLGLAALIIGAACVVFGFIVLRVDGLAAFSKALLIALGVLLVVIAALGIWMAVDFNSFWAAFHIVFLDLESSTFDPAVSNMICICPEELFSDIIIRFATISGLGLVFPVIACVLTLVHRKKHSGSPRVLLYWLGSSAAILGSAALVASSVSALGFMRWIAAWLLGFTLALMIIYVVMKRKSEKRPSVKAE